MRLFGRPNIEKLSAKRDIDGLIKALIHKDTQLRRNAAAALARLCDTRAVEHLITALKDHDPYVRALALEALGTIGDSRAVEPLVVELQDINTHIWTRSSRSRREIAKALGQLRSTRAVASLVEALQDGDDGTQGVVLDALQKIDPQWAKSEAADRAVRTMLAARPGWVAIEAAGRIGSFAIEPLLEALKANDDAVRQQAAVALGNIGYAHAVEPLLEVLTTKDHTLRITAIVALGKAGDARSIEPLVKCLSSAYEDQRAAAEKSLEMLDWQPVDGREKALRAIARGELENVSTLGIQAIGPLLAWLKALDYESGRVDLAEKAVEELGKIGGAEATEALVKALNCIPSRDDRFSNTLKVYKEIMDALRGIGIPAIDGLLYAIKDKSFRVRCGAAEALALIVFKEVEYGGAEPLVRIGHPCIVEVLVNLFKDSTIRRDIFTPYRDYVSAHVLRSALETIGYPEAYKPLIEALEHSDPSIRMGAADTLGEIGHPSGFEPLLRVTQGDQERDVVESGKGALTMILEKYAEDVATEGLFILAHQKDRGFLQSLIHEETGNPSYLSTTVEFSEARLAAQRELTRRGATR